MDLAVGTRRPRGAARRGASGTSQRDRALDARRPGVGRVGNVSGQRQRPSHARRPTTRSDAAARRKAPHARSGGGLLQGWATIRRAATARRSQRPGVDCRSASESFATASVVPDARRRSTSPCLWKKGLSLPPTGVPRGVPLGELSSIRAGRRVREGVDLTLGNTYTINLTATDSDGFGAIVIVMIEVTEAAFSSYDLNGNHRIERDEVIKAVADYFRGLITKEEVIEVIKLYFQGDG